MAYLDGFSPNVQVSNEYRRIKGDDELDANNWYEYVEYGTTNPLTRRNKNEGIGM